MKLVHLPKRAGYEDKKTIIFDLDETLVHCLDSKENAHVRLPIRLPNGTTAMAGVNIRPHVRHCLEVCNQNFEVIVFTASQPVYAD
jgi:CTD small phosphatase-like protein 2